MRLPRFLWLLLLAYVCLDIANPLMPGAVQFVAGTIQVVEADRARPGWDMHILVASLPARLMAVADREPSPLRRVRPVRTALRRHPLRPMDLRSQPTASAAARMARRRATAVMTAKTA